MMVLPSMFATLLLSPHLFRVFLSLSPLSLTEYLLQPRFSLILNFSQEVLLRLFDSGHSFLLGGLNYSYSEKKGTENKGRNEQKREKKKESHIH